jgi:hypothetical protein
VSCITLPRRAPREVYRVYTENEYLAGVDGPLLEPLFPADAQHRLRRVASAAVLVGAFGAVGVVLVLNSSLPSGSAARRLRSPRLADEPTPVSRVQRARLMPVHTRAALQARVAPAAPHRRDLEVTYPAPPSDVHTGGAAEARQQDVVSPRVTASAQSPSPSPSPGHSEFGFER